MFCTMRFATIILFLSFLSGCSTYKQTVLVEPSSKLIRGGRVLIATPDNTIPYVYAGSDYQKSGQMVAAAVRDEFKRFASEANVSPNCKDISCLAQSPRHDYYVIPEILHWEDRGTDWGGLVASQIIFNISSIRLSGPDPQDVINIKMTIFDANQKEVASATLSGQGDALGSPQRLLSDLINKYVMSLY